ncbi:polymorphic toxin-type HINT domain-containing protein [Streptomyces sp. NPDC016845]|uniref:polymorphic toxin-type HINT domain-containing protein n=1 Tax=Streptomyces sp. NPDC016845 TaxID=3364972 RepID=UPI0037A2DBDD
MLLSAGLLSGLLGSPTAVAAEPVPLPSDIRAEIVEYWETGGAGLKEAAEQALLGGDDDIRTFLDEAEAIQHLDNRVETARLAMTGGSTVREAAKEALLKSPDELESFLLDGFEEPLDLDNRVEIGRLVTLGGQAMQETGKEALLGTAEDREIFLNKDQYTARQLDDRVEVARLATVGGPNVKAAAKIALRGTPDDMVEFLEVGQFTARNRDQEHASIEDLIKQAKAAGKQADDARKTAEESSKKAIEAAALAKEAALQAAEETAAAKDDSKRAAVKAAQAADAARGAAEAAQEAIGSANAANRAAHRAALAAAQTAAAAAAAADSANNAYKAAIAASANKDEAENAKEAAKKARAAADAADESAVAAGHAGEASAAAGRAAAAAKAATGNARAAATAAEQANAYADAAGVHSSEARQAAVEARRHANAADAAADRSAALANRAAIAAYGARDAATSAAKHARKAATYADEAAEQAGNAATYAATAKKNAEAAKGAADTANDAVAQAKTIFALARETEEADLTTRTESAIELARSVKTATEVGISASAATQAEARSLNDTATVLAQEADRPDVDIQATAVKGRQLAMQAMKLLGPWHQEAAARALSGTDQDVLDYLRTRWKEANQSDIRQRVVNLSSQSPYASVRSAASEALNGSPEQIEAFYASGQYEAGFTDMRVDVARLAETGGSGVSEAAKAALLGSGKTYATFLNVGQYGERLMDERVTTARLAETGGPEVQAAAKIALAGPPQLIHDFVSTGQYMAQRKDDLASHHVHQVERLLAEGGLIAAKATENAWRAAEAAAKAEQASDQATAAAEEAQKSKEDAERYAADADTSADAAEDSAADAASSAATARNAADRAAQDASAAESSAYQAEWSASYARNSAREADQSAAEAKASAVAAGKSAKEAEAEASAAWKRTRELADQEMERLLEQAEEERKAQEEDAPKTRCASLLPLGGSGLPGPLANALTRWTTVCDNGAIDKTLEVLKDPHTYKTLAWELSGLADIQACIEDPTALGCVMAVAGVLPSGKYKLVTKIDDALEWLKASRDTRRAVACLTGAAHSFPAGTGVLMADGTSRPIEQLEVGDLVRATNPATGESGPRRVTRTIHTPDDRNFTDVTLADGSTLTSTSHHPFWSENDRAWKNADTLRAGDTLRTPRNTTATITGTHVWQGLQDAYDLTVEDLHTYYVSTGTTNVLVHNTDASCPLWVLNARKALPKESSFTSGYVFTADGKKLWQTPVTSGRTPQTEEISRYLQGSPDFPYIPGYSPLAHHAEVKTAWEMRSKGEVGDALHIVINKNYLCPKATDAVQVGCKQSVPAILFEDQVLCVWLPGAKKAQALTGKVKRPGSTWTPPVGDRCKV